MKGIGRFTRVEIKLVLRDKSFYLWALLLPLFFVFVFSGLGGSGSGDRNRPKPGLKVSDRDGSELSRDLAGYLEKEDLYFYPPEAREIRRELIIPAGFSDRLTAGEPVTLPLKVTAGQMDRGEVSAGVSITRALYKFIADHRLGISAPGEQVRLETRWLSAQSADPVPSGHLHQVPATIIIFLMFNLLIYGGITVVTLRDRGILRRMVTTPTGKLGIWASLLSTNIFVGIIVILMIFGASALVFDVSFFRFTSIGVFAVLLVYTLSLAALGIFMGSVFKRHETIVGVSVLVANLLAALGGCWWPIEVVGDFMKKISLFIPTGWAMQGLDQLLFYREPFEAVLPHLLFLLLFGLFFSVLSIRFFQIHRH